MRESDEGRMTGRLRACLLIEDGRVFVPVYISTFLRNDSAWKMGCLTEQETEVHKSLITC